MANALAGLFDKIFPKRRQAPAAPSRHQPPAGHPPPHDPTSHGSPAHGSPSTDSKLAGVEIEYEPRLDGDPDPGEIVWTWVPWEEDPSQGKDRPVVIVGRRGKLLVGVPLTSKHHDNERQVEVGTGSWDHEGRVSYAKLDRILDVDPAQVRREGAILDRRHFDQIVAALRDG